MKHVSILIPEFAVVEAIADPRYAFTMVNNFLEARGEAPLFDVKLVGLQREVKLDRSAFTVHADHLIHEVTHTDLIIVPAISGDLQKSIASNQAFIPWLQAQAEKGAEIASLCLGAFLLAATGLLDNKQCSTHWLFANEFRSMFPQVELVDGSIITDEQGIYSSGGANSYWNLLLYLVEKYSSRDMAILIAKFFAIDINRNSQASFMMFEGQKDHADDVVKSAQQFIESNFQERISVDELAGRFATGRRSFERRFKSATRNTVAEYIQRVKVEAAKRSFECSRKNINEVMYDVGYSDTKAFRTIFKKLTGLTPVEYRNRYKKHAILN